MEEESLVNRFDGFSSQNWDKSDVIDFIIKCLDKDETYVYKKGVRGSTQVTADLFLPNGCRNLGFLNKSIVEIKRFITRYALQSIRLVYDYSSGFNEMIVISGRYPQTIDFLLKSYLEGKNIRFITIEDLVRIYDRNKERSLTE